MARFFFALALVCASFLTLPQAASAQQLLESYTAMLSSRDHYNSNGQRLTQPWQIIRQDRANFHRFGRADPQDQWDSFFGSMENRGIAERMMLNGSISGDAARRIVNGEVVVNVEIWGSGNTGRYINVTVY